MTTNPEPLITDFDTVAEDPLAIYETVKVPSDRLQGGMVLVDDELGTAEAVLINRERTLPGGIVEWNIALVDLRVVVQTTFPITRADAIKVAAK